MGSTQYLTIQIYLDDVSSVPSAIYRCSVESGLCVAPLHKDCGCFEHNPPLVEETYGQGGHYQGPRRLLRASDSHVLKSISYPSLAQQISTFLLATIFHFDA